MTLRDLAEFEVRNRLLAVPGVAAVERLGGYLRQFQVQIDPDRMSARGVTLDQILHAVEGATNAPGASWCGAMEWRCGLAHQGLTTCATAVAACGCCAIGTSRAPAVRRGIAHRLRASRQLPGGQEFGADIGPVAAESVRRWPAPGTEGVT
jgi:cobalt-zinc-cadmium resistance protein CzcA